MKKTIIDHHFPTVFPWFSHGFPHCQRGFPSQAFGRMLRMVPGCGAEATEAVGPEGSGHGAGGETKGHPWENWKTMRENYGKTRGKIEKYGKTMGKPWENVKNMGKRGKTGKQWDYHRKTIGKPWENKTIDTIGKMEICHDLPSGQHTEKHMERLSSVLELGKSTISTGPISITNC